MSKKIYIVSQLGVSNAGGVEKISWYLQELLKEKYDVSVITKGRISFGKLNNLIQPVLISIRLWAHNFGKADLHKAFVIGNSWHCFLYPADISIHHGTSAGIIKHTGESGLSLKLTSWMEKVSARRAKKVLAVSENCKKELIELYGIDEAKIFVLNNFVQDEVFTPLNGKVLQKDEALSKIINVCFSGALLDKKGLDKLLEFSDYIENEGAQANLPKSDFVIKLNIATNYEKNAQPFMNRKTTSVKIGLSSEQMPAFYCQNDIMFFPTKYEGFSMAALEALSCGLPLIGTRFAVGPELEGFDFCRLVTNQNTPQEIIEKIIELYTKYSSESGRMTIHNLIKEKFGTEQYKNKLYTFIENMLK